MYIDLVTIDLCPGQGGGGVKPSGTLEISKNGVYNVYTYASANVNVPTGGFNDREVTEGKFNIVNLNNSASFVNNYAFNTNSYVQTVDLSNCYEVENDAFTSCANLTTVNLPVCSSIGSSAFMNCSNLTTVNLPMCNRIGSFAFMNCSNLTTVNLPMCNSTGGAAFRSCYSLSQVNLPMVKTIGVSTFNACSALTSLTLCTDVYWTIPFGARTYVGTPITNESGSGSIYVRSDTYSLWISSNLWSEYSSKFVSVPVSGPALSFSNGLLSGTTKAIASDFTDYLSVSKSDITGVSLPECKYLMKSTFADMSLNSVYLPECEVLYGYTFKSVPISSIDLPKCKRMIQYDFDLCQDLQNINLPQCDYLGPKTFANCGNLKSIDLPLCTTVGANAFDYCFVMSSVSLPMCKYVGPQAFHSTLALSSVNLPVCSRIDSNAFAEVIETLVLGYDSVVTIPAIGIFTGNIPSIFVPASLVEAYKADTNWSQYSDRIFPIS